MNPFIYEGISKIQMRILYVKRAYNTRLNNQVTTLLQKGHRITLLLDAPIVYGYNGPCQWDPRDIQSSLNVYYTSSARSHDSRHKKNSLYHFYKRAMNYRNSLLRIQSYLGIDDKRRFLRALDRVLSMNDVDLIISGNDALQTEDIRTRWVIENWKGKIPIVYDCQDILTDCFSGMFKVQENERFVNEESDGVIHTNPIALKWMTSRYRIARSTYFPNYGCREDFQSRLPKLSKDDGLVHLVYCGSVQKTPKKYPYPFARDLKNAFREIASLGFPLHLHLGLYPDTPEHSYYMELKNYPNITLHRYLPFKKMMENLSRYDVGLFPVDFGSLKKQVELFGLSILDDFALSRADTCKQYEYTLAGLPVLTAPLKWISQWLERNNFGTSFHSASHLYNILKGNQMEEYADTVKREAFKFSIEEKISHLENFLLKILDD